MFNDFEIPCPANARSSKSGLQYDIIIWQVKDLDRMLR